LIGFETHLAIWQGGLGEFLRAAANRDRFRDPGSAPASTFPSPISALLLADGGYATLNPPQWIVKLSPEVIPLSVAAGHRDGRSSSETLEEVKDYTLLRTNRDGWIEPMTDGDQMWVEVERK
jgi:hypothetical protein